MIKVFVLEHSERVDVAATEQYGALHYIFPEGCKRTSFWATEYVEDAIKSLDVQGFNAERDLFVITGHFNPVVIMVAKLIEIHKSLKVLLWNSVHRKYELKTIGENYK